MRPQERASTANGWRMLTAPLTAFDVVRVSASRPRGAGSPPYSVRSAVVGSALAALTAGDALAMTATITSIPATTR